MQIPIMQANAAGSVLAYGYEAVARGALEADVKVVSGFPGTPSTGALEALASVAGEGGIHVEWATNERVALETAWGAAMDGQRAMCTMNHLGMNVVMDALKYCANYGVTGGMVVFVGDDVGANTSAIESDSRVLACSADVPVLTPCSAEEARRMTRRAFSLSEELGCPVVVRSVCQLMMARTLVDVEVPETVSRPSDFAPNPRRVVMFEPGTMAAVTIHRFLHENLSRAGGLLEEQGYDAAFPGPGSTGIIACGVSYPLVKAAMVRCGVEAPVLKLSVMNPLNERLITGFAASLDRILVFEEGEAYAEEKIQAILGRSRLPASVLGRLSGELPFGGELFVGEIESALRAVYKGERWKAADAAAQDRLFERDLTLCGGCGHMGLFYALRKAMEEVNGGRYLAFSDAGCAFMGILAPAKSITSATNMGGGISFACGAADAGSEVPVFALCGDGGFLHGGVSALAGAVFNRSNIVAVLLDNAALGNTGLQPTGCTGRNAVGQEVPRVDLEGLCRSLGIVHQQTVDPLRLEDTMAAIKTALKAPKPAVIIARQPCVLNRLKAEKQAGHPVRTAAVDPAACRRCGKCGELYCTAIVREGKEAVPSIRADLCSACGMCVELCSGGAIGIKEV